MMTLSRNGMGIRDLHGRTNMDSTEWFCLLYVTSYRRKMEGTSCWDAASSTWQWDELNGYLYEAGVSLSLRGLQTISAVEFKNGACVACVCGLLLHCVTFSQNSGTEQNERNTSPPGRLPARPLARTHALMHSFTHARTHSHTGSFIVHINFH